MKKRILFSATPTEKRAALLEEDQIVELVIERPDSMRLVGNVYRAKVEAVVPGLQAAFLDIGFEKRAFLHTSDVNPELFLEESSSGPVADRSSSRRRAVARVPIEKVIEEGQQILVQAIKEPISTKGVKLTTQISIAGRFLVLIPDTDFIGVSKKTQDNKKRQKLKQLIMQLKPKGVGFIVRTIGLRVSEEDFVAEIKHLIETWKKIQEQAFVGSGPKLIHRELGITSRVIRDLYSDDVVDVYVDQDEDYQEIMSYLKAVTPDICNRVVRYTDKLPLFDKFNVEKTLERSLKRKVWLKSGGYVLFDHAEALLAIDVNTGRNVGKSNVRDTILTTNLEAAREIGRQLRLRDIGGIIVVDFIDMEDAPHRHKLEDEMRSILDKDPTVTSNTGLSKFGLMEITRKRVRPELQELYTDVCPACNGLGWVFSAATVSTRIDRWLKRADSQNVPRDLTLSVHPAVSTYLHKDNNQIIKMLQQEHHVELKVVEDPGLDQDEYEFFASGAKNPIELKS